MNKFFDLPECWQNALASELDANIMHELAAFVAREREEYEVYPAQEDVFSAFHATKYNDVKVVIIGQDPYHGVGQAHGLSFSVRPNISIPPSLKNIYKEIESDLNIKMPSHGYLMGWAKQGVLLLNTVLTVRAGQAGSHQKKGWEVFTDAVIRSLAKKQHLVFLLWGSPAQKKAKHVSKTDHLILTSVHPSPLSVYRGFFGSRHFSKTNDYLTTIGARPIKWDQLPLDPA